MKKSLKIILFVIVALAVVGASVFAGFRFATMRMAALGQGTMARQFMGQPYFGRGNNMPFQQGQGQWQGQNPGNTVPAQPGQNPGNTAPAQPGQNPGNTTPAQPGQNQNPGYNMPFRQGGRMMPWNNGPMSPRQFGNQGPFMGKGFGGDRNGFGGRGDARGNNGMMSRRGMPFFIFPLILGGGFFGLVVLALVVWGLVKLITRKPRAAVAAAAAAPVESALVESMPLESPAVDKPEDPAQPADLVN